MIISSDVTLNILPNILFMTLKGLLTILHYKPLEFLVLEVMKTSKYFL